MKFFAQLKLGIAVLILIFAGSCCNKNGGTEPSYPIYSYNTDIINPPSRFQINYTINIQGDKVAQVTFKENSVWIVEKLGDSRVLYSVSTTTDKMSIISRDTIGFQKNFQYFFIANNNMMLDLTSYLVDFIELDIDYDTFEPKF